MEEKRRIVYCHCAHADVVPPEVRAGVLRGIAAAGAPVLAVPDLCERAACRDPALARIAGGGPVTILACHERTVRWLFAAAGAALPEAGVEIVNLRATPAEALALRLADLVAVGGKGGECACGGNESPSSAAGAAWAPWFPVIDYARCTDCGQCLGFCLFDVFVKGTDGRVCVANPRNCKTNCPACARVCPAQAIMFPKHKDAALSGGEGPAGAPVDVRGLVAGDLHATLRARGKGRKFALDVAEQERRACACSDGGACACAPGILDALGVPPEVAAALSPADLAARAAARRGGGACDCDCGCACGGQ
jgi:NAD-dependent dihydropyrimidine dehydrogenase PreA subunit